MFPRLHVHMSPRHELEAPSRIGHSAFISERPRSNAALDQIERHKDYHSKEEQYGECRKSKWHVEACGRDDQDITEPAACRDHLTHHVADERAGGGDLQRCEKIWERARYADFLEDLRFGGANDAQHLPKLRLYRAHPGDDIHYHREE